MYSKLRCFQVITFGIILFSGMLQPVYSQNNINKVVEVVKPYEPSISDAFKINLLPKMNDTTFVAPSFDYNLKSSKRIDANFDVRPITAAKMVGLPLTKLYKSYLKLGIGNYFTPLAELNVNSLRSKDHSIGLYLKHLSSDGNVTLANNANAYAGYGDNEADLYGKKIFKNAVLSGDMGIKGKTVYFYGYNPKIDTILLTNNIKQTYTDFNVGARLNSTYIDSSHLNYDLSSVYHYYTDRYNTKENDFTFGGNFNLFFMKQMLGLDIEIRNIGKITQPGTKNDIPVKSDTSKSNIVRIEPWWGKSQPEWSLTAALNTFIVSGDQSGVHFYPKAKFQFNAVEKILIPYVGIDGNLKVNSYRAVSQENPFITPGLSAFNTSITTIYAGLKGSLSSKASYNIYIDRSSEGQMLMYINDTVSKLGNRFIAFYDDAEIMGYHGDLSFKPSEKLIFEGKINFYSYNMVGGEKAWHEPSWNMDLSANYNLKDKIIIKGDVFSIGKRYARPGTATQPPIELQGITDVNLGIEYRYSKIFSIFLNLNNLGGAKYYMWNEYPTEKFNFMVGLTYAL